MKPMDLSKTANQAPAAGGDVKIKTEYIEEDCGIKTDDVSSPMARVSDGNVFGQESRVFPSYHHPFYSTMAAFR